jgi:hypothetical protein
MRGVDRYFSPVDVAKEMARQIPSSFDGLVFDPAAGNGALLAAAIEQAPSAEILAADVDAVSVAQLRAAYPHWTVGSADVLNPRSRGSSSAWRRAGSGQETIVLLNPPFSFRGGSGARVILGGESRIVSPAVAFLLEVARSLDGVKSIIALLPEGCLHNLRDRPVWRELHGGFEQDVIRTFAPRAFPGAVANTVLVRLDSGASRSPSAAETPVLRVLGSQCTCVDVIRGRVAVEASSSTDAGSSAAMFLHTTDLADTARGVPRLRFAPTRLATRGDLLLIPRVGPGPSGRIKLARDATIVLSDCLFALRTREALLVDRLNAFLVEYSTALGDEYRGTGARHLTLERLAGFLRAHGWAPRHVGASATDVSCSCGQLAANQLIGAANSQT